jgi:hypothetical protein
MNWPAAFLCAVLAASMFGSLAVSEYARYQFQEQCDE